MLPLLHPPRLKALTVGGILLSMLIVSLGTSVSANDRGTAIEAVITRQLDAFRRQDADAAWAIAAPSIQKRFGTKARFMEMVESYYPQIMNSRSATFRELREVGGSLVQRVFVDGGPGDFVDAYYTMEQIDGAWRITGVYITKPKPEGV